MTVVIPMAGRGSRLAERASEPKPLVRVAGRPMIEWAMASLRGLPTTRMVFVVLAEHERAHRMSDVLRDLAAPVPADVVSLPDVTQGQLCTVLAADRCIDLDEDLLVASCDTYVRSDLAAVIARARRRCHGIISLIEAAGEQWSFARLGGDGAVVEVAEKVRISNLASTGLYYFSSAREFVDVGRAMVEAEDRTRGEYFVMPVYARYLARGWRVEAGLADEMWDMGNPEALDRFEAHLRSGGGPRLETS